MKYFGALNPFKAIADSVNFPHFVSDLLASLFGASLDIQEMNEASIKLVGAGFIPLWQNGGPYQPGDVALAGSRLAVYNGRSWVGFVQPGGPRPPYRIYRRR